MTTTTTTTTVGPTPTSGSASQVALLRLAFVGGRSDRLRVALTVTGAALATLIALLGMTIAFIRTSKGDGPYTIDLIDESGLRPGVLVGLAALAVPVVVFVGLCTRVGAPGRDRRLSMLRMAGATPSQATRIAGFETGLAAGMGALVGTALHSLARLLLHEGDVEQRTFPTDVDLPTLVIAGVVVAVTVGAVVSSAFAMRRVRISPFGVHRIEQRQPPGRWAAMIFAIGFVGLLGTNALLRVLPDLVAVVALFALVCFILCFVGLLVGGASFAVTVGRFLAARTSRPSVLIAARRMTDAPYTSSRATASVLLAVLIGSAIQATRSNFLTSQDPADTFYRDSFDLINVVLLIAIVIAAASLVVTSSEAIVERRRTLAALAASGTPRSVMARAAILEPLVPLVPTVFAATAAGTLFARSLFGTTVERLESFKPNAQSNFIEVAVPVPWVELTVLAGGAITVAVLATVLSLLLLPASTSMTELRTAA